MRPGPGTTLLLLALVLGPVGCTEDESPTQAQLLAVAALDPAFGSADALIWTALAAPEMQWVDDVDGRTAFLLESLERFGPRESDLTETFVATGATGEDLEVIVAFLASKPGRRLARAQRATHAGYGPDWPAFLTETLEYWSDPEQVGEAAARKFDEAGERLESGESTSPPLLALTLGAMMLRADDARALRSFLGTPAGSAWKQARERFGRLYAEDVGVVRQAATDAGVLAPREELPDLVLPDADFTVPGETGK